MADFFTLATNKLGLNLVGTHDRLCWRQQMDVIPTKTDTHTHTHKGQRKTTNMVDLGSKRHVAGGGEGGSLQSNPIVCPSSGLPAAAVHGSCHLQHSGHFQPVLRYSVKPNLWEIPGYFWMSGLPGSHQHVTGCSNLLNLWIGCNTGFCILAFLRPPLVQQRRKRKSKKGLRPVVNTKLITLLCIVKMS